MSIDQSKILLTAGVMFPALCVFGSQFLGGMTRTVNAGVTPAMSEPHAVDDFSFNEPDFEDVTSNAILSPLYSESVVTIDQSFYADIPEPVVQRPRQEPDPTVSITSILPHPKNPLAIINGKPHRVGDVLESGWKVMSINGQDFTVTLRHSSGKEIREGLKKN